MYIYIYILYIYIRNIIYYNIYFRTHRFPQKTDLLGGGVVIIIVIIIITIVTITVTISTTTTTTTTTLALLGFYSRPQLMFKGWNP